MVIPPIISDYNHLKINGPSLPGKRRNSLIKKNVKKLKKRDLIDLNGV